MTTEKKRSFIINFIYVVIIILIIYFVMKYAISWIMPFIVAFIVAAILNPLIRKLSSFRKLKRHRRRIAAVITALFFCTAGVLLGFIISELVSAIYGFISNLPEFYLETIATALEGVYEKLNALFAKMNMDVVINAKTITDTVNREITNLSSQIGTAFNAIRSIPSMLMTILLIIISTFYIAMDYEMITKWTLAQLPRKKALFILELKDYTAKVIFRYIRSYGLILLITFFQLLTGFAVMHFVTGLDNIFLLSLIIAVFDILPIVGTGTVLVPWLIVAFITGDYASGICLTVMYVVITVIRQFIEPKIVGDQVGLHPIAALLAMLVGTGLFGGIGLFTVPVALAIIKDLNDHGKIHVFKPIQAFDEDYGKDEEEKEKRRISFPFKKKKK